MKRYRPTYCATLPHTSRPHPAPNLRPRRNTDPRRQVLPRCLRRNPPLVDCPRNPEAIRKDTKKPHSPRLKWMWLEEKVERFVLRRADMVLAGNIDNMAFVLSQGVLQERSAIIRIGNSINTLHFVAPNKTHQNLCCFLVGQNQI